MRASPHLSWKALLSLMFMSGLACPTLAVDRHWTADSGLWSEAPNWTGNTVPGIGDSAYLGFGDPAINDVENSLVRIDQPAFVDSLWIDDGMHAINSYRATGITSPVTVSGILTLTGGNQIDGELRDSRLTLLRSLALYDLDVDTAGIHSGSRLELREGAVANIHNSLRIYPNGGEGTDGELAGQGVVNLTGAGQTLRNGGMINPNGVLTINQQGGGTFNLDGDSGTGQLLVGGNSVGDESPVRDHLTLNGIGLSDSFGGQISMANGRHLTMNLSDGWTADPGSILRFSGAPDDASAATINGGHVTLEGRVNLLSLTTSPAHGRFNADATINDGFSLWQGPDARLRFDGQTPVNGGEFNLQAGASVLLFTGPTTLRGGEFNTHSKMVADGSVVFDGETAWNGEVTINGVAIQANDATVTEQTVINATRVDFDGIPEWFDEHAGWQLNAGLTVNAENINDGINNVVSSEITVGSGTLSRLTVNLANPDDHWTLAGTLNLNNALHFGAIKLGGSDVQIAGAVNVNGADIRIDANTEFAPGSVTTFVDAESSLTMRQHGRVMASAEFVGDGLLRTASTGSLTLDDGANTSNVGVLNQGHLDIDDAIGIAAIDRFENAASGTLRIDLAGHLLGEEFDHLQVTGEASIDGTLEVSLLTVALSGDGLFTPEIGDEFLIMTSLGGVSGEFAEVLPTFADGNVYGWEVLYHPHDITIRLASVGPAVPEPATLAMLLFVSVPFGLTRRR